MTDRLVVDRHHCRYRVSRSHPDPAGVRRRLDSVVADRVPSRLAEALAAAVPSDDGVIVIRRLGVRVLVGSSEPELLAATTDLWAKGLATAILKALARGDDDVVRFPSRASYLGAFLTALGRGDAWSGWAFDQFLTLRALGPGGAAVAACAARAELVAPALGAVAAQGDQALAGVLALLSIEQARLVGELAGLPSVAAAAVPAAGEAGPPEEVARLLRAGRQFAASPAHLALWLLGHVIERRPAPAGGGAPDATARSVASLAGWGPELLSLGLLDGAGRAPAPVAEVADPDRRRRLEQVRAAAPAVVDALGAGSADPAEGTDPDGLEIVGSAFGGCVLLLVGLGALDLEGALAAAGVGPGAAPPLAGRLRWWALLSALGREQRLAARYDPVLLRLAGDPGGAYGPEHATALLDGPVGAEVWRRVVARATRPDPASATFTDPPSARDEAHLDVADLIDREPVARLVEGLALLAVRELARRLPGFSASSAAYVATNLLVGSAQLRFAPTRCWSSLPDVALRVALQMAGWEDRVIEAPWLPGGEIRLAREWS